MLFCFLKSGKWGLSLILLTTHGCTKKSFGRRSTLAGSISVSFSLICILGFEFTTYIATPPSMAMAKTKAFTVLLIIFYATLQKPTIVDGANDLVNTSTIIAFNYVSTQTNLDDLNVTSDVTTKNGIVWLTPDPNEQKESEMGGKTGWLLYSTPLTSLPNITSFHTSFHFQLITPLSKDLGGDGLAFFISPYHTIPNQSGGGFLGIANGTSNATDPSRHLFAVENVEMNDSNNNHVGIDINGVVSTVFLNTTSSDLDLYQNSSFMAWVDYYASNTSIEVRMVNIAGSSSSVVTPPLQPLLSLEYDLSTLFLASDMFVGLSATTGASYQGCAISSWNFSLSTSIHIQPPSSSSSNMSIPAPQPQPTPKSGNNLLIIIPSTVGGGVVVVTGVIVALIAYRKRCCRPPSDDPQNPESLLTPSNVDR